VGELIDLRGIQAGIENSNFFVDTLDKGTTRHWVLTLFERLGFEQLPFYLELMRHLAQRGIPVPMPQADAGGAILHTLKGKPAALVDRLPGGHQLAPDAGHCTQVGAMLARMHEAGRDFAPTCAVWAGGSKPCRKCCRMSTPSSARCSKGSSPTSASSPRRRPMPPCPAARSTPTCSATT
jgi:hypothetical protein